MAEVELHIGGRHYQLACADGEEQALQTLAMMVDEQIQSARLMAGGLTEARQLLFAAILLADRLVSAEMGVSDPARAGQAEPSAACQPRLTDDAVSQLVSRIDALAHRLETIA